VPALMVENRRLGVIILLLILGTMAWYVGRGERRDGSSMHEAVKRNDIAHVARLLQRNGVDARDNHDWTPLHLAVYEGNIEVQRLLVQRGADVNSRNNMGATPLHIAAHQGDAAATRLLLASGADVNAQQRDGLTPLHIAAVEQHVPRLQYLQVVRTLLDNGARPDARDRLACVPWDYAVRIGHADVARLLGELDRQDRVKQCASR
jgi:ankyrin repeat protein